MFVRNMNGELIKGPMERNEMLSAKAKNSFPGKLSRQSRPQLYMAMITQLRRVGVPVEHGKEVVDYFEHAASGCAGVVLKDGSRHEANLVIAADGVHSRSWKLTLGHEVPARPSGDAIFRVSYPVEVGLKDPLIATEYPLLEGERPQVNSYIAYALRLPKLTSAMAI
jgi:2-polyprenyl-6-methoxyphenol hydroxylase-like FAD-dependent oxidoreductase